MSEILQEATEVKVLATSRARLGLRGEVLLHVGGMDYPPTDLTGLGKPVRSDLEYGAVKLFLSCAQQVQPRFDPRADDLAQVVRVCHLVEGMPLAILLAAAWVPALTVAEIAEEIASQIPGQSLDFLEADWRDAPPRQHSMRAAFDHSWHLLSDREQAVFAALAVFRGGCTREAAQQVTGASLRELISLVDKSMLQRAPAGRYDLHELLRQYAAEKLAQSADGGDAVRSRHAAHYAAALQQWAGDLKGPRQVAAIAEMDVEIGNARAAWNWAAERGQVEALGRAVDGLGLFYDWRVRYEEGEAAFRTAADRLAEAGQPLSPEAVRVWAKVLAWQGSMHYSAAGDPEPAMQLFQQSLDPLGEPGLEERSILADKAFVLRQMGEVSGERGDLEKAQWFGEQSLALYRESGDRSGQAVVLLDLGEKLRRLRVLDESRRLHEESLALHQELGNLRGIADTDVTLAVFLLQQGALEEGERLARESLVIYRQIDDLSGGASLALWFVGLSLYTQGRFAEALAPWEEYEALSDDLGRSGQGVELAWARAELGQYDQARAAAQKTLHMSPKFPLYRRWIGCAFLELGRVALAEEDDAAAQQLIQQALPILQEMRYDEDVGPALSTSGIVALRLGQLSGAQQHLAEALRVGIEAHMPFTLACALAGIALLLARRGEVERAVELYALASRDPVIAHSRWYEDVVGQHIAAAATALPPDIIASAQDRGRARDLWATVEELAAELG